jgi:phosphoglucomutase/phosphomannomutase
VNEQTIGESAQGLADYVRSQNPRASVLRCAIGYDTRHRSREFAELCSEVMAAAEFQVCFLDGFRSTPLLSFTVRAMTCDCGIMVSASHNPPTDNAVKVFWSTGGQLCPPHDRGVMQSVGQVASVNRRPFVEAQSDGRIACCQAEMDARYREAVLAHSLPGPRDLKILYSPLHGVGLTSVLPILAADGFVDVEVFGPQAIPDGDFPNVPDRIANPERPEVFDALIDRAEQTGADLALASDPDADRIGCAARLTRRGRWKTLTGNQIGVLLADYILRRRRQAGSLGADSYIVKTLVATEMLRRVADLHQVRTIGDVLTGFKWIAQVVDAVGAKDFVFATEEAHGYMVGDYVRDKDAAGAAMLLAELAAESRAQGRTLHEVLEGLYDLVGYHAETAASRTLPGPQGMADMRAMMDRLRRSAPLALAGMKVVRVRDYLTATALNGPALACGTIDCPPAEGERDLLFFDLSLDGSYAAVRPSGTEPKLKFYFFAYRPPKPCEPISEIRKAVAQQLARMESDLLSAAGGMA